MIPTLASAISPDSNPAAKSIYGTTGGFQPIRSEMFRQYEAGS